MLDQNVIITLNAFYVTQTYVLRVNIKGINAKLSV